MVNIVLKERLKKDMDMISDYFYILKKSVFILGVVIVLVSVVLLIYVLIVIFNEKIGELLELLISNEVLMVYVNVFCIKVNLVVSSDKLCLEL